MPPGRVRVGKADERALQAQGLFFVPVMTPRPYLHSP